MSAAECPKNGGVNSPFSKHSEILVSEDPSSVANHMNSALNLNQASILGVHIQI